MTNLKKLLIFYYLFLCVNVFAKDFTYFVVNCHDGDTCRVRSSDNINIKIRLIAIDAPEVAHGQVKKGQAFGNESKNYLNSLIKGKKVELKNYSEDHFGRNLSEIFIDNINVNIKMIENGMAEVYRGKLNASLNLEKYFSAEKKAKKLKIGIWSLLNYESPSLWRKNKNL
ncbi:thermonuclease family protein [Fluviispira vulneris]|uniref:thermonuclease family protein n=1 Tax=Fluviispira vulneris TaxID=2763012 RepID=UPI001644E8FA|nr:thermonuclease family protein [Fluviispira vulneris]